MTKKEKEKKEEQNFRCQVFLTLVKLLLGIQYEASLKSKPMSEGDREFASWLFAKITAFQKENADDDQLRVALQKHRMTLIGLGAKAGYKPAPRSEVACRLRVFRVMSAEIYWLGAMNSNNDFDGVLALKLLEKMCAFFKSSDFRVHASDEQYVELEEMINNLS